MNKSDVVIEKVYDMGAMYSVSTNAHLLSTKIESFEYPDNTSYWELVVMHGPAVAAFVKKVMRERGVDKIFINPYEVTVHMAGANKITDKIRETVKEFVYLAAQLEDVVESEAEVKLSRSKVNDSQAIMDFNFEVTKRPFKFSKKYTDKNLKGLNANLKRFLKKLVAIDGVNGLEVSYYQIVIDHAPLFDMEKIGEEILTAYVEFAGKV